MSETRLSMFILMMHTKSCQYWWSWLLVEVHLCRVEWYHVLSGLSVCVEGSWSFTAKFRVQGRQELWWVAWRLAAKLIYASSAWWGSASATDHQKLKAFIWCSNRAGFYSPYWNYYFEDLYMSAVSTRFQNLTWHVLEQFFTSHTLTEVIIIVYLYSSTSAGLHNICHAGQCI